jgi:hypothetical protein
MEDDRFVLSAACPHQDPRFFFFLCYICFSTSGFFRKTNMKYWRSIAAAILLAVFNLASPAFADNAVQLKILVIATGSLEEDPGLAYIQPVLDEIGAGYDVLNSSEQDLKAATLASASGGAACRARDAGCTGNYSGIILTDADLVPAFTPSEWDILHDYQADFGVRQAVLSGRPVTYADPRDPQGVYLDYGLAYSSSGNEYDARWTVPAAYSKEIFEYVNRDTPLRIRGSAHAASVRNNASRLRDGTVPRAEPLLRTDKGEALVSLVRYTVPSRKLPVREVMISTIDNTSFHLHSKVLAYEFVNWVTQGVFVGARHIYMAAHVDDLFRTSTLWDPALDRDDHGRRFRLAGPDINNVVGKQRAFQTAHPLAKGFRLDFAFNGSGAVRDPAGEPLTPNLTEDLVAAVVAAKKNFRFINHTFGHADLDKAPASAGIACDYATLDAVAAIQAEITRNQTVWEMLGLPEQEQNKRVLVTGSHSGLKDRKCTSDPALHPEMLDVQADDVSLDNGGANPLFLNAAASVGVRYLAADSSQRGQTAEKYIALYEDGSPMDRLMLPRWPTNIFYNVTSPSQLEDEYNHLFYWRYVNAGRNPCKTDGAICSPRTYSEILAVEAENAVRHMLTFNKWPHFFHQANLAEYDEKGNTLLFDWLNAVFVEYERLLNLPVMNYPYYLIGDLTQASVNRKSASIKAIWNRTTNQVTLSADKAVPDLPVTGLSGGSLYGGQLISAVTISARPRTFSVDRALAQ